MDTVRELVRLLREAQAHQYDLFCDRGIKPVMAYLMIRQMGGYLHG